MKSVVGLFLLLVIASLLAGPARGDMASPPASPEQAARASQINLGPYVLALRSGYESNARKKLEGLWTAPIEMTGSAVVAFDLDWQGVPTHITLTRKSGCEAADKVALKTIEKCEGLGPLPAMTQSVHGVTTFSPQSAKKKLALHMIFKDTDPEVGLSGSYTNIR